MFKSIGLGLRKVNVKARHRFREGISVGFRARFKMMITSSNELKVLNCKSTI